MQNTVDVKNNTLGTLSPGVVFTVQRCLKLILRHICEVRMSILDSIYRVLVKRNQQFPIPLRQSRNESNLCGLAFL